MADKKKITSTPPSLVGGKVYLRPATAEDIAAMHYWRTIEEPLRHSWRAEPISSAGEAAEQFKQAGASLTRQQFAIVTTKGEELVGQIGYDDLNPLNRSAQLKMIIDPEERKKDYGAEALRLLCAYLFRQRDLNKMLVWVSALHEDVIRDLETVGFDRDGTMRQHHFFDGDYYDVYIYSLLRFDFSA